MIKINQFFKLFSLSLRRKQSENNYIKFQQFQANLILNELKNKKINFKEGKFLELGCGKGGYSLSFIKEVNDFSAADISVPKLILEQNKEINFIQFDFEENFLIKNEIYDTIFCASVIEHIKNKNNFLREIKRILKNDGKLILTFPPFYTPVGGHVFKPFHYFGEKIACKLTSLFKNHHAISYEKAYGSWGLYPLKLKDVENDLKKEGFIIKKEWVRFAPNFTKIPFLREILSWQVHFLCEKPRKL